MIDVTGLLPPSPHAGVLEAGTFCLNANKGKKERIGRLMLMHANNREDIKVSLKLKKTGKQYPHQDSGASAHLLVVVLSAVYCLP